MSNEVDDVPAKPRVGGWGIFLFLFGFWAGTLGWMRLRKTDRRRARHVLKWGFIWSGDALVACAGIVVAVVASAVSDSNERARAMLTTELNTTSAIRPDSPAATRPTFETRRTWSWQTTDQDGYTVRYQLEVARPARLEDSPYLVGYGDLSAIRSTCARFDPATDAIIAAKLELKNTSSKFRSTVATAVSLADEQPSSDITAIKAITTGDDYSLRCDVLRQDGQGQGTWEPSCRNLSPQSACGANAYIIVTDYFTPSDPKGDRTLPTATLRFSAPSGSSSTEAHSVSGPGAYVKQGALILPLGVL